MGRVHNITGDTMGKNRKPMAKRAKRFRFHRLYTSAVEASEARDEIVNSGQKCRVKRIDDYARGVHGWGLYVK